MHRHESTWARGIRALFVATGATVLGGCQGDESTVPSELTANTPTWENDIAPLVQEKCVGCHRAGGNTTFSMETYASVKSYAGLMAYAVDRGHMPPFLAEETSECQPRLPWQNDIRLSKEQKATLRAWADADAPEGKPIAALSVPAARALEREDVVMYVPELIRVEGHNDIHTCMIVDPHLLADSYVLGRTITAGNPRVLHHVVSYVILPGVNDDGAPRSKQQLEAVIRAEKGVGIDGRYPCFGGPALTAAKVELLDAWAPGSVPNLAPPESGQPIDKDSLVLLDVHYHPAPYGVDVDLGTKLSLMTTTDKPKYVSRVTLIGNFAGHFENPFGVGELLEQPGEQTAEFVIPAGSDKHVEAMTWTWTGLPEGVALRVYGAGTHMHYAGRDMRVSLSHPASAALEGECLIQTPNWNFDWQRVYSYAGTYDQLPTMTNGDVLDLRCTYDNSLANPRVFHALQDRGEFFPGDVRLGENTLDEMCLAAVGIMYPAP